MKASWTPLFSKIVDSSLWAEPDHVRIVFITMLALKDEDHVVRFSAYAIAQRAKKTEVEVLDALKILSSPDRKRIEAQPYEGRRVKRVDDGWLILNGEYYLGIMRNISRKVYKAKWMREHRGVSGAGKPLPGERAYEEALRSGDDKRAQDILDGQA